MTLENIFCGIVIVIFGIGLFGFFYEIIKSDIKYYRK